MWLPLGGLRACCLALVSGFCPRGLFKPVPRAVRVERFGVETFERLRGEAARRLVPGCEALEPVGPGAWSRRAWCGCAEADTRYLCAPPCRVGAW